MCRRPRMCRHDERSALKTDRGRSRRPGRTLCRSRTSKRHRRSIDRSVPQSRRVRQASPYRRKAPGRRANSRELSTILPVADPWSLHRGKRMIRCATTVFEAGPSQGGCDERVGHVANHRVQDLAGWDGPSIAQRLSSGDSRDPSCTALHHDSNRPPCQIIVHFLAMPDR
jgi:hypothetical protein